MSSARAAALPEARRLDRFGPMSVARHDPARPVLEVEGLTVEMNGRRALDDVSFSLHRPWPGSAVWRRPKAFGVKITHGPDFEAYIETESLSRAALLERTEQARETLAERGISAGILRCDRYPWE